MTVAILDGPLGREATHTWTPASGISVALNDPATFPRFEIDKIRGWRSRTESDDNRAQRTARHGEKVWPSFRRGKTVVYEGRLVCRSLPQLRAYATLLNAAFLDTAEGTMLVAPHPAYGSVAWTYTARVLQVDIDEDDLPPAGAAPTRFQVPAALALRMSDARFYLNGPPATSGPHASGATAVVTNEGLAPTDRLVLTGAVSDTAVTLENLSVPTSNGTARLRIDTNFLGSSLLDIAVDFDARTIVGTIDGGEPSDLLHLLDTSYSQWWDEFIHALQPGANQLKVTGLAGWTAAFTSATP